MQVSFAYMDGRIDPPSSIHRLTLNDLKEKCETAYVWSIGHPCEACVVITPIKDGLYIGKLAVAEQSRGKGHARHLINAATGLGIQLGLRYLELETRVELSENHAVFEKMDFHKTDKTAHDGYTRPTSITMRRLLK
nr:GNAT family N-acetyltransferase [Cochlodiniinecator piscidefendens]